jgi:fluoride exporter
MSPTTSPTTTPPPVWMAEATSPPVTSAVVGVGGAVGSVARYLLSLAGPDGHGFPWPTLAVNLTGAFALGLLAGALWTRPGAPPLLRPFLGTGVLGGFTTFSALAVETVARVAAGRVWLVAGYVVLTFAGGVLLAWAGVVVGERV